MDINSDIIKERTASSSRINPRRSSTHLNALSILYYERVEALNNLLDNTV